MDEASLDDFLDGSDASDDAGDGTNETPAETDADAETAGERDPEDGSPAVDPAGVEPATSTYAWSATAVACAACGESVERRWRDDAGMVCQACKEW